MINLRSMVWIALLFPSVSSAASDYPSSGILYNTKESNSLVYRCQLLSVDKLECEFTQTSVRHSMTAEQKKEAMKKQQATSDKELARERSQVCDAVEETKQLVLFAQGKIGEQAFKERMGIDENGQEFQGFLKKPKAELLELGEHFSAANKFCRDGTKESALKIADLSYDQELRTCVASSNIFNQTFNKISDSSGNIVWIVADSPSGQCGIVNLSRFEKAPDWSSGWIYTSQKKVMNKKGKMDTFLGEKMGCDGFDEEAYLFDWKSETRYMNCDYIKFSVL